uniref:Auxin response factor 18-like n=1 Tax=Rhizophora mucronata TaxID=61149 RepID=A0A2P2NZA7_RHIMU
MPITAEVSPCRGTVRRRYSRGWITRRILQCRRWLQKMCMGRIGSLGIFIEGRRGGIC